MQDYLHLSFSREIGLIFFLFMGCMAVSCTSNENKGGATLTYRLDDFPVTKDLVGSSFTFDSILNPRKILLKGDYLIVSENNFGNLIHVLEKKTMRYLKSTGNQGDGPGQIRSGIWYFDAGLDDEHYWAYDLTGKSFYKFSLLDSTTKARRTIRQNESWFLGYSIHQLEENRFISYMSRDGFKFGIFDSLGSRISSIRPWSLNDSVDQMKGYILMGLNQGPMQYNPKNRIFAHAGIKYEFLEILHIDNGDIIRLEGPSGVELKYEIKGNPSDPILEMGEEVPRGFRDLYVGQNSIFLIYIGKTLKETREEGETPSLILEFGINGEPKGKYQCDLPVRAISVDESEKKIYAVTGGREPGLAIFDY
ncbi:BF3164 family lipoprotein [Algoriphagus namhaensis]